MLDGAPPYTGPNARAILARKLTAPPAPLRQARPEVPADLETMLLRALSRYPAIPATGSSQWKRSPTRWGATAGNRPTPIPGPAPAIPRPPRRRRGAAIALGLLALGGAYEVELTEVFRVQSEIAEQVTAALDLALHAPERDALADAGTRSPEAYDFYLRGNEYAGRSYGRSNVEAAVDLYARTVALDSGCALAQARLARSHAAMYWFYHDRSPARCTAAKQAAGPPRGGPGDGGPHDGGDRRRAPCGGAPPALGGRQLGAVRADPSGPDRHNCRAAGAGHRGARPAAPDAQLDHRSRSCSTIRPGLGSAPTRTSRGWSQVVLDGL